ncbi:hypothetical protein ABZ826_22240 [Streptomyces sp. NPDC047515]|uniref:hypothetical protein n=1 Tax=Streptomyces sp. NPDC047515 TaxID=3155380 RepID=UPI0033E90208
MVTWLTDHTLVYGSPGVLAAVLLLPAPEAAPPLVRALLPVGGGSGPPNGPSA